MTRGYNVFFSSENVGNVLDSSQACVTSCRRSSSVLFVVFCLSVMLHGDKYNGCDSNA